MNIEKLRTAIKAGNIEWRKHTLRRLAERNILQETILQILLDGELIEDYPQDTPFPSSLFFHIVGSTPYHVVASLDETNKKAYIITVYEPSLDRFEADYKTRRKK